MPIVCFHGSPGLPEEFIELEKLFPKNQLITFARKGYPNASNFQDIPATNDVLILGYSWGNVPAVTYALKNKTYVKGFIMVSPFLYPRNNLLKVRLFTFPVLSDFLFSLFGKKIIKKFIRKSSFPLPATFSYQKLADKLAIPSIIKTAILEKKEQRVTKNMLEKFANTKIPVGLLWGSNDITSKETQQILPLYRFIKPIEEEQLQNAGHAILFTHSKQVADFIKKCNESVSKRKKLL